jgi:hypothetical protein
MVVIRATTRVGFCTATSFIFCPHDLERYQTRYDKLSFSSPSEDRLDAFGTA